MSEVRTAGAAAFAGVQAGAVQKLAELSRLLEVVEGRRPTTLAHELGEDWEYVPPPVRVLEIGSYVGGTLCAWRTMWPDAFVVAVDLPDPPDRPIVTHGAHLIVGDSHAAETWELVRARLQRGPRGEPLELEAARVDLLFVDGDHSEAGVRSDLEMYGTFVKPGGLVALHDVVHHPHPRDAMGPELVWPTLDRWTLSPELVGDHLEIVPVWKRYAEIIDTMPLPDGSPAPWGGIGVAERLVDIFGPVPWESTREEGDR